MPTPFQQQIYRYIPAFDSLRTYSVEKFRRDCFAGLTVAAVAVPQAMAYASIFGMPVEMGLYTAIVMTTVGALLDSSKQLINGPTNAISIAMLSALAIVPEDQRIMAAIMMGAMVGIIQTSIGLFRFGDLTKFISHAVIVGFTLGASVLLLLDQLKNILGLQSRGDPHDHFLVRFWHTMTEGGSVHLPSLSIATLTIVLALTFRWLNNRFRLGLPEFLLALFLASLTLALVDQDRSLAVRLVDPVPRKLPSFSVPSIDLTLARELSVSAAAIAFLGVLEALAMAKSIAVKTGQKLDMNQQCLSEGLANFTGSFFSCFPGSGSLTRSYINHTSGAATQWSGVVSAAGVAATILLLAPFAQYIPRASLAAILILTAFRMTDFKSLRFIVRTTRFDATILLATALSAVFISVEFCILIGVFLSFAFYVPKAAKIDLSRLVFTKDRVVREVKPDEPSCDLIRLYNLEGEMFFACGPELERLLESIEAETPPTTQVLIFRLKRIRNPDAVCVHLLYEFIIRMQERGITIMLTGVRESMQRILANVKIDELIGKDNIFVEEKQIYASTTAAMQRAYKLLGPARCRYCHVPPSGSQKTSPPDTEEWTYVI